ncbi:MAG: hypothetical protein H7246_01560 [Phycisphaerae bacterium]|nr:hypothetical protein [Saprospiraceae bacterium]
MAIRFTFLALAIATLFSCQAIIRHHFGIKNPDIEKEKTVIKILEKNGIKNNHFVQKEKIDDAYIGSFPKIYIYDRNGYQVMLYNCYEMIEENLRALADTIPDKLSDERLRDLFVQETIQTEGNDLPSKGQYDYEVFFYWSVWLGKFNLKKLRTAQKSIDAINQASNKKLILIPVNFDFIEEAGWTEESAEAELKLVSAANKKQ